MKFIEEIKRSIQNQTDALTKIHQDLKTLNHNIEEGKIENTIDTSKWASLTSVTDQFACISADLANQRTTIQNMDDKIKYEIQYDKDYTRCVNDDPLMMEFIEEYIKPNREDKIELFNKISKKYKIIVK